MPEEEIYRNLEKIFLNSSAANQSVMRMIEGRNSGLDRLEVRGDKPLERFLSEVIDQAAYTDANEIKNDAAGRLLSAWLKKKRLHMIQWEPNKKQYPKFMLLGTDKGILAYVETFYHHSVESADTETVFRYGICHRLDDLISRLILVDSDLDRPVFYVHILDYPDVQGVFFETTEMIKQNLYVKSDSLDLKGAEKYYFSNLYEMGDLDELAKIFEDLKKNNVTFY